ncbi:MAG: Asp-tRNA(Asn)/Glu-tRNA(Gln) amidotransferase subunit GatB [Oscillospiraceae bacterium]|jgi:aspartyl-tRNA(Asn)/glutamyl-tRNA(Gln) amidotransferase subunit B|nr:Asp-tRNA(Asn)/Glu-tRNA(Gln) amidotransferase subunit GatB [Oscillospiraceae bacterium]
MEFDVVIGLEVHVELKTESKMYCSCKNEFGGVANSHCCEICLGMPGTLPNINKKAIEYAIKAGLAFNCQINTTTKLDRKNYFYPDLPKSYQISQSEQPLCVGGFIEILLENGTKSKRINLVQIHVEEDSGKTIYGDADGKTYIDFNRSGVPLIEIVSKPDLCDATEVKTYLETIKNTVLWLGISDCKMQEGSMRADINISLKPKGAIKLGTRCEIKNVGSINGAARAVECEIKRQKEILESGRKVEQVTLKYSDEANENIVARRKDEVVEYRYFVEPDLPAIEISNEEIEALKLSIGELPNAKISRLMDEYELPYTDAYLLMEEREKGRFFEETAKISNVEPKKVANWILGDISRILNKQSAPLSSSKLTAQNFKKMLEMIENNSISNTAGKTIIETLMEQDIDPELVAKQKGLLQTSDLKLLEDVAREALAENKQISELFEKGKTNVLGFAVGDCMKRLKGKGNPVLLKDIVLKLLEEGKSRNEKN